MWSPIFACENSHTIHVLQRERGWLLIPKWFCFLVEEELIIPDPNKGKKAIAAMLRLKSKRRFASFFVFVLICSVLNLTATHANCCLYIPSTVVPTGSVSRQRKVAWQTWTQIFALSSSRVQLTSTISHIWGLVTDFRSSKTCQR